VSEDDARQENDARDILPEVEFYDPFSHNFSSRKREDPLLRLYDKKIINDDF
jgi:hypothetical protein